jgi:hypothetical protein
MSSQQQQQQQPEFHHVQQQQQQQQQQHVSQPGMIYNSTSNTQQTPNYSQRFWYNLSYDMCDIHRSDFSVSEERRLTSECHSVPNIGHCVGCFMSLLYEVFSLSTFQLTVNIVMWCYTFMWVTDILVIILVFHLFKQFFVTCFWFLINVMKEHWILAGMFKAFTAIPFWTSMCWDGWTNTSLWHVSEKHKHGKVEL